MNTVHKLAAIIAAVIIITGAAGANALAAEDDPDDCRTIDINVSSIWDDENDKDGMRTEEILITLFANGNETGKTAVLDQENDWSVTFCDMPVTDSSGAVAYSVVEDRLDGYTCTIAGSDRDGFTITNIHKPMPEGRSSEEEIRKGSIVATVVTSKVSRSTPVRTRITIDKTMSAKTADASSAGDCILMLIAAITGLVLWMRYEQENES